MEILTGYKRKKYHSNCGKKMKLRYTGTSAHKIVENTVQEPLQTAVI